MVNESVDKSRNKDFVIETKDGEEEGSNQINLDHLMIMNSRNRANIWANENLDEFEMIDGLRNGLTYKKPHHFRDISKDKHLSEDPFLNRT